MLLTSRSEGTPVSAIESLASGRPVVATDVGGTRDVVEEGISGFLVPFGDVAAGAERLERLALDPALRARMGAAGQGRTLARYAVPRLVGDIDRLYRSLLQVERGHGRGPPSRIGTGRRCEATSPKRKGRLA